MTVSLRHVVTQAPVIFALGRVALEGLRHPRGQAGARRPEVPGPWIEAELAPRPAALVRDYVRHVGGDPGAYRGVVPAHLFPQWGFPLAARALAGLPYPLARVMNAGCHIEQFGRLPADEPLHVRARIEAIDDDGRRAIITQRIVTGTARTRDVVVADLRAFVPLARPEQDKKGPRDGSNGGGTRPRADKPRPTVPTDARELAFFRVGADAGLDFAKLTGDFNPIHWVPAYARASGFKSVILHGFATLARAIEALNRARFAGDPFELSTLDARFTRPLVLPARVGVYASADGGVWVGDAPGGGAYLEGRFTTRGDRAR
ncbi:MAG: hypothetical protein IT373_37300 [Polyangiaceae bacterium]|nr:hypothetical protein [Polyangiaceae bacterium]